MDCPTTPDTDDQINFPNAGMSGTEMFQWFEEELGMSPEEV